MKQILLALICLTSIKSVAQKTITTYYDVFKKHKKEVYTINAKGQYNGKYTLYFEDGTMRKQCTYLNGKLNGLYKSRCDFEDYVCYPYIRTEKLYKDEHLIWEKEYNEVDDKRMLKVEQYYEIDGLRPYLEKGYDEEGKQIYQVAKNGKNFQDGNLGLNNKVSSNLVYEPSYKIDRVEFASLNDKKDGLYREWHYNGRLADSSYWKDGVRNGMEFQYYDDGTLKFARNYVEGVEIVKINDATTISGYHYIGGIRISTIDSTKTITNNLGHYQMFNRDGNLIMTGDNTSIVIYDGEGKIIGRSKP